MIIANFVNELKQPPIWAFDGLLYDISTSKVLNTQDAFKVYGYLYKKKNFEVFY